MELLGLLVPFAAAGGWLWWIYRADRFEKEPWGLVWGTLGVGAAAGLAGLVARFVLLLVLGSMELMALAGPFVLAPVQVLLMAGVLYLLPYRRPAWNEPFDGLVYGGAAGIGYGLVDSVFRFFVYEGPLEGLRIGIYAIPIYMLVGIIVGHYMSQTRFGLPHPGNRRWIRGLLVAWLYVAGIEFAFGLGGDVMGSANPVASAFVYAANTIGWVLAMHAMDAKHKASQFHPENYRILLADTGCPHCGLAVPVAAAFCSTCGQPLSAGREAQA